MVKKGMDQGIDIVFRNQLNRSKRDVVLHHNLAGSSHIVCPGSEKSFKLKSREMDDYITVQLVSGSVISKGDMALEVPTRIDFDLNSLGNVILTNDRGRVRVVTEKIQRSWNLKLMVKGSEISAIDSTNTHITLGDIETSRGTAESS